MNRVKDKIALVTGAAQGIGRATAELLALEGAQVIITDIKDDIGKKSATDIGKNAVFYHLDVSQEMEWKDLIEFIRNKYKRLDILVNNAGINGFSLGQQDPENATLKSWHKVHAINLDSVFLGCKYGISLMKEYGGSIINISSRSGIVGIPNAAAYASSKAAIRNHTKTVALYCAEKNYNIRCNSLHPATILTAIWDPNLGSDPAKREESIVNLTKGIPLKKMGEPIDVAYAVLYFASDEAKYITGAELNIDGGILAGSTASPK